jgi:hypothetical protein
MSEYLLFWAMLRPPREAVRNQNLRFVVTYNAREFERFTADVRSERQKPVM